RTENNRHTVTRGHSHAKFLRRRAVEAHLAARDEFLRQRPGFREARVPQPLIKARRAHEASRSLSFANGESASTAGGAEGAPALPSSGRRRWRMRKTIPVS